MKRINRIHVTILAVILLVMALVPSFLVRVNYEQSRKNVVVALSYNDLANNLSWEHMEKILRNYYDAGVTVINVPEEDVESMSGRGAFTSLTYGDLAHKYDEESVALAQAVAQQAPETDYLSRVLLTKDPQMAEWIGDRLAMRKSAEEYSRLEVDGTTLFVIYDGRTKEANELMGFDEKALDRLQEMGFEIALALRVQDSNSTGYLEHLEQMVEKYDVRYLQLVASLEKGDDAKTREANYEGISRLAKEHDLTLVINEDQDQLSNKTPFGYNQIFGENSERVIRAYENPTSKYTTEANKAYALYTMFFNSTIDRHIRFINIAQVDEVEKSFETISQITVDAARQYINKVESLGYTVNGETEAMDYRVDRTFIYVVSAAVMVLLCYLMFVMLTGNRDAKWNLAAAILAVLAAGASFVMPAGLTALYPTAWAVIMPCFCITTVFTFIKYRAQKLAAPVLSALTPVLAVLLMYAGGIVMCSLLSGIDYYMNNLVFRGVKLSLILPILYGLVAYFFLFMDTKQYLSVSGIRKLLTSRIQVYWVLLAGAAGAVAYVYLLRSGNVNTISSMERLMRDTLSELFAARPRTKEFLIGYPCLVLFAYYMKQIKLPIIQAGLAAGGSIVIASVSNSYCHVFTDALTIYSRTLNGLIVGAAVCVAAYIANLLLIKIVKAVYGRIIRL